MSITASHLVGLTSAVPVERSHCCGFDDFPDFDDFWLSVLIEIVDIPGEPVILDRGNAVSNSVRPA